MFGGEQIKFIAETGLLSLSYALVHASSLTDDAYRVIADGGVLLPGIPGRLEGPPPSPSGTRTWP
ncbi:hypothetical protein ABTY96_07790 [Streptomyces sp. NPDC096057]|uniref:hypothetical protein n=1 Tax=Streptomyces sp. NPDC096057 TaxID=3155543 RepID=UPI00332ECC20